MSMPTKRYLGDGVYVAHDGFGIMLTTENGISVTNRIILEPSVIFAFEAYIQDLKDAVAEANVNAGAKT